MTDPRFVADEGMLLLGEQRIVFHCHHYNTFLQRSIEEMLGEGAIEMQIDAAAESTRRILEGIFPQTPGGWDERIRVAGEVFSSNGFGCADLTELTRDGGRVLLPTSHYAIGWRSKFGRAKAPVCHFATGFWRGALAAAAELAPERVFGREQHCHAVDEQACTLRLEVR